MKILKYTLIGIVCLVAIILILGLILPKEYSVARSTVVNAPQPTVLAQIKSLKTMDEWSPWSKLDPNMKQEFGGPDGEVGSWNSWEGNDDVGKGKQEVTAITGNSVDIKLSFMEPWESVSDVNFSLADTAGSSKVTWTMKGKSPFPFNVFGLFMNMDEMIGNDFEKGLGSLKARSEAIAAKTNYSGFEVMEINMEPRTYLTIKDTVKFEGMQQFFREKYPVLFQLLKKAGVSPAGPASAIYYTWDTENKQSVMAAAVPVVEDKNMVAMNGLEQVTASGKALMIAYRGAYENLSAPHNAMDECMKEKNIAYRDFVLEEYLVGPMAEKDTAKWLTNIYYMVK